MAVKNVSRPNDLDSSGGKPKKKIAPRSGLQFKVGPQFSPTSVSLPIILSDNTLVSPCITSRLDRGFELEEGTWIGYKRNYFSLVSSFQIPNLSFERFLEEEFYTFHEGEKARIKFFGLKMSSYCLQDGEEVKIIEHTAKRDKGPHNEPGTCLIVPGSLPEHQFIREFANIRNKSKIIRLNKALYYEKPTQRTRSSIISNYEMDQIARVVRYERLQFASSINHRRPAGLLRQFKIRVELLGFLESGAPCQLAKSETPPLVIRGRSPSTYQKKKPSYPLSQLMATQQDAGTYRFQAFQRRQEAELLPDEEEYTGMEQYSPPDLVQDSAQFGDDDDEYGDENAYLEDEVYERPAISTPINIMEQMSNLENRLQKLENQYSPEYDRAILDCNQFLDIYRETFDRFRQKQEIEDGPKDENDTTFLLNEVFSEIPKIPESVLVRKSVPHPDFIKVSSPNFIPYPQQTQKVFHATKGTYEDKNNLFLQSECCNPEWLKYQDHALI